MQWAGLFGDEAPPFAFQHTAVVMTSCRRFLLLRCSCGTSCGSSCDVAVTPEAAQGRSRNFVSVPQCALKCAVKCSRRHPLESVRANVGSNGGAGCVHAARMLDGEERPSRRTLLANAVLS